MSENQEVRMLLDRGSDYQDENNANFVEGLTGEGVLFRKAIWRGGRHPV